MRPWSACPRHRYCPSRQKEPPAGADIRRPRRAPSACGILHGLRREGEHGSSNCGAPRSRYAGRPYRWPPAPRRNSTQRTHGVVQSAHSMGSTNDLPSHRHSLKLREGGGSNKQLSALHERVVTAVGCAKQTKKAPPNKPRPPPPPPPPPPPRALSARRPVLPPALSFPRS